MQVSAIERDSGKKKGNYLRVEREHEAEGGRGRRRGRWNLDDVQVGRGFMRGSWLLSC
jgi:hypothetical protein